MIDSVSVEVSGVLYSFAVTTDEDGVWFTPASLAIKDGGSLQELVSTLRADMPEVLDLARVEYDLRVEEHNAAMREPR
jgi:hypothetical protein